MDRPRDRSARRRGSALIVVLITVVGILALLGILFPLSQSGLRAQRQSRQQFELNLLLRAAIEEALDEIRTGNDPDNDGTGAVGLAYAVGEAGGDGFNLPDPLEAQLGVGVDGVGPDADDLAQLGKPLAVAIDRDGDGNDGNSPGEVVRPLGRYLAFVDRPSPDARTLKVVVAIPDFLRPDALAGAEVRLAVPQGGARHALSITGATGTPGTLRIESNASKVVDVSIVDNSLTVPALNVDDPTTYAHADLAAFVANATLVKGKSVNGGVPALNLAGDTVESNGATLFSVNQAEIDRAVQDVVDYVADLKSRGNNAPGGSRITQNYVVSEDFNRSRNGGKDGSGVHTYTSIGTPTSYDPDDVTATDLFILGRSSTSGKELDLGDGILGSPGISISGTGVLLIENGNSVEIGWNSDFYWKGDVIWIAKPGGGGQDTFEIFGADVKIDGNLFVVLDPGESNKTAKLKLKDSNARQPHLEVNGSLVLLAPGNNKLELRLEGGPNANQPFLQVNGLLLALAKSFKIEVKGKDSSNKAYFGVKGGMVVGHASDGSTSLDTLDFKEYLDAVIEYDQAAYDAALKGLLKRTPGLIGWSSQGYLERPGVTLLSEALTVLLNAQTDTTAYSND
ncbi:MAG: hypothetical protein D6731_11995 [Planctomycetota bacterium]|nr:MAG: hypothetical protein D6731_11995 [Planctomycetota bacterium]